MRLGGPVGRAAQQREDGGQEGEGAEQRAADADGTDRAERPVVGQVAEQEREQPGGHRPGAGGDRPGRPAPRGHDPGQASRSGGELLAVPGRQQEGVVGAGADHQDEQDALHLPVDRQDVPSGERVHDGAGQRQGEHRPEDDHQWQQHAAVHHQEDQQHDADGDPEEQHVDARERVAEVGLRGGGAADVRACPGHPFRRLADAVDGLGDVVARVGGDLHDGLQRGAVPRRDRRRRLARDVRIAAQGVEGPPGGGTPVVRHAAAVAGRPDDDRRDRPVPFERGLLLQDPRRFGAGRQEGRLVVGGDLPEPARERPEHAADDEPGEQEDDGDGPAGDSWCGHFRSWFGDTGGSRPGRAPLGTATESYLND
ncbi:hypothetical protein BJF79_18315 [Actinomadura sp. CNU-125]|nr:hypothetical protein BJF79_18315 [Actinomadura sp. CNU-125]